eukprot:CAMPEP_0179888648 /NCGR_PEP_ID=MMETSP0982-20121206/32088_1 /TAXON_ID=483367 /ORGANISM="non described non described, Strain CCMP 2436" /LENGTH=41 /DNA_ID= /DNA_START= /DNA_END= /DNA_ORIENTATION=
MAANFAYARGLGVSGGGVESECRGSTVENRVCGGVESRKRG